jgi:hypothetical protein
VPVVSFLDRIEVFLAPVEEGWTGEKRLFQDFFRDEGADACCRFIDGWVFTVCGFVEQCFGFTASVAVAGAELEFWEFDRGAVSVQHL